MRFALGLVVIIGLLFLAFRVFGRDRAAGAAAPSAWVPAPPERSTTC